MRQAALEHLPMPISTQRLDAHLQCGDLAGDKRPDGLKPAFQALGQWVPRASIIYRFRADFGSPSSSRLINFSQVRCRNPAMQRSPGTSDVLSFGCHRQSERVLKARQVPKARDFVLFFVMLHVEPRPGFLR